MHTALGSMPSAAKEREKEENAPKKREDILAYFI